jgi:2-enoate reductase
MIIGGGIAGMEAARVAEIRGHRVFLYEKKATLGGLVQQAAVPEFKKDLRRLLSWYERQIEKSNINVFLNCEITPDLIRSKSPDVVLVATGANAIVPTGIPGVFQDSVVTAVDLLKGEKNTGDRVVIVGGGLVGCEMAIWLADQGKQLLIVEMLPALMMAGAGVPGQVKMMTMDLLAKHETTIMTSSRVCEIKSDGILIDHQDSGKRLIEAESVVLAMGMKSETGLADQLETAADYVYRIGDCREPRNVMNAVWDAYEIARYI